MNYSDLITFFINIGCMAFMFYLGYRKGMRDFMAIFIDAAREQGLVIDENGKVDKQAQILSTEIHHNSICLYNQDGFICQGTSLDDIAKIIQKNNKFKKVVVKHDDSYYLLEEGNVIKSEIK